jgi:cardiolipin synthase
MMSKRTSFFGTLLLLFLGIWGGIYSLQPTLPQKSKPAIFYSNQTGDDLRLTLAAALERAKHSVLVVVYTLSDVDLIGKLNELANRGVRVQVIVDHRASSRVTKVLSSSIQTTLRSGVGLMHQKAILIDQQEVWVGSANFTRESLQLHGNLVMGLWSRKLAAALEQALSVVSDSNSPPPCFSIGEQQVELWIMPKDNGLQRLLNLIQAAQKTIHVAMFTFTHPDLAHALVGAHQRGVKVRVVADRSCGKGASKRALDTLRKGGVCVSLSEGSSLLHHKLCSIDGNVLINGSTNWTRAAFSKNDDLFLVISPLTSQQKTKLAKLWNVIWSESA